MLISCPECGFSRTIDETKVPATAQVATCPRCEAKFRFRNLEGDAPDAANSNATPEQYTPNYTDDHGANASNQQDANYAQEQYDAKSKDPVTHGQHRDIWDHIASLGEKWEKNKQQSAHKEVDADYFMPKGRVGDVPWENMSHFGVFGGFIQTVIRVLMRGRLFFSSMPARGELVKPIAYFILIVALHFIISILWIKAFSSNEEVAQALTQFNESLNQVNILQLIVFIPLNSVLTLLMLTVCFSVYMRLAGIKNVTFTRNLRIICYASTGLLFIILPIIGPVLAPLWVVFSTFQGFMYSYNLSPGKALTITLPVYLLLLVLLISTTATTI